MEAMQAIVNGTYLTEILHGIAQGLLGPTMVVIILLVVATLFFIGQVIVEFFTERRGFKENLPGIINDVSAAPYADVTTLIEKSRLLKIQKAGLVVVSNNMGLPEEPLFALAQVQVARVSKHYQRRLAWTEVMSKIGPMLGLMGTLIPLGPGIVSLGQGDTASLSQSLLVAFDATVCGLVCAVVALIISKIRAGWYAEYQTALEALMSCVIDKAARARAEQVQLPFNYRGDPLAEWAQLSKSAAKGGAMSGANGAMLNGAPIDGAMQAASPAVSGAVPATTEAALTSGERNA